MITENLSTLKIHKLTQEQYERELAAGNIDPNAIYLTPDEEIDLSQYATLDQLDAKANAEHDHSASEITYDNTVTGIGVTNVQDAIDFLAHNAGAQGGAVLYSEEQNLTDAQKAQALENIGVEIATDDEIIDLLVEADTIMAVADADGSILSDESDNILIW